MDFECSVCANDLVVEVNEEVGIAYVKPCEACLQDKYEAGFEEGGSDGWAEGYDEGYEEGYSAGAED